MIDKLPFFNSMPSILRNIIITILYYPSTKLLFKSIIDKLILPLLSSQGICLLIDSLPDWSIGSNNLFIFCLRFYRSTLTSSNHLILRGPCLRIPPGFLYTSFLGGQLLLKHSTWASILNLPFFNMAKISGWSENACIHIFFFLIL